MYNLANYRHRIVTVYVDGKNVEQQTNMFPQQNQRDALISQIHFLNRTLHVSGSFSVHHQESSTVHTAMVYVIQVLLTDIYLLLCKQCWIPDDGQRNCPKHVGFYSRSGFERLVHLVGFVVRMYHDARSSECQKKNVSLNSLPFT